MRSVRILTVVRLTFNPVGRNEQKFYKKSRHRRVMKSSEKTSSTIGTILGASVSYNNTVVSSLDKTCCTEGQLFQLRPVRRCRCSLHFTLALDQGAGHDRLGLDERLAAGVMSLWCTTSNVATTPDVTVMRSAYTSGASPVGQLVSSTMMRATRCRRSIVSFRSMSGSVTSMFSWAAAKAARARRMSRASRVGPSTPARSPVWAKWMPRLVNDMARSGAGGSTTSVVPAGWNRQELPHESATVFVFLGVSGSWGRDRVWAGAFVPKCGRRES